MKNSEEEYSNLWRAIDALPFKERDWYTVMINYDFQYYLDSNCDFVFGPDDRPTKIRGITFAVRYSQPEAWKIIDGRE